MDSDDSDQDVGAYQSSDDEDYVPEGASADDDDDEDYNSKKKKGRTPKKKATVTPLRRSSRRKRGGIKLREPDSDEESEEPLASSESDEDNEPGEDDDNEAENEQNEEEKKRITNIWESMKQDGNSNNKSKPKEDVSGDEDPKEKNDVNEQTEKDSAEKKISRSLADNKPKETTKIEEKETVSEKQDSEKSPREIPGAASKKRPGGLSNVLGSISKKQKISTLDKSKKDWDSFKKEQGIEDELRNKSKDGFLSKQEFLQRVDYRKWENERELRLATGRGKKPCSGVTLELGVGLKDDVDTILVLAAWEEEDSGTGSEDDISCEEGLGSTVEDSAIDELFIVGDAEGTGDGSKLEDGTTSSELDDSMVELGKGDTEKVDEAVGFTDVCTVVF
eukprot:gene1554-16003_t